VNWKNKKNNISGRSVAASVTFESIDIYFHKIA
jgi:hypothetical protein